MIEVLGFREVNKGCLESKINIKDKKRGLILYKIGVFNKNGSRWITLPQEEYENNGEKKYFQLIKFDDPKEYKQFQDSVLKAIDDYKSKNTQTKNIQQQEDLPF